MSNPIKQSKNIFFCVVCGAAVIVSITGDYSCIYTRVCKKHDDEPSRQPFQPQEFMVNSFVNRGTASGTSLTMVPSKELTLLRP